MKRRAWIALSAVLTVVFTASTVYDVRADDAFAAAMSSFAATVWATHLVFAVLGYDIWEDAA